jgi:hypothetical protein
MRGLHVPSGQQYTGMKWSEMKAQCKSADCYRSLTNLSFEASFNALKSIELFVAIRNAQEEDPDPLGLICFLRPAIASSV